MLDLTGVKKIYFIGIGGVGMSAVAGLASARGFDVSGSDDKTVYDPAKAVLDKYKIKYSIGYAAENLQNPDLVVVSAAIEKDNPELVAALGAFHKITAYPELLATLASDKRRIVVVGTHGKGSTSGLIGSVLKKINDSSFFIGGVLKDLATNFYLGTGPDFVIEGDEYRAGFDDPTPKFLYYKPDVLLINNLELDHPDIYSDLEAFKAVFKKLVSGLPKSGILVYNADDQNVLDVIKEWDGSKFGFGFKNSAADLLGTKPKLDKDSDFICEAKHKNSELIFHSAFPGTLYGYNNLAALATLIAAGYDPEQFLDLIEDYSGLKKRFEIIYDEEYTVIDDYAHHPTAVLATLEAARLKYPDRRLIAVFEPHTYSRTKEVLPQLAKSFGPADLVYISEIYPAREIKSETSVTGKQVVKEVLLNHKDVYYAASQADCQAQLKKIIRSGDVIVVMSVGPYKAI